MGKVIDPNKPYSPEEKQYLTERGRAYLIPANERRFGADGTRTPEAHEQYASHAVSPFYNIEEREAAVYDVGGAPLPGTVLNRDTGRVLDRENGVDVEFTGPGHTPGGYDLRDKNWEPEGFSSYAVDGNGNPIDDKFDQDIVDYVTSADSNEDLVEELKAHDVSVSDEAAANRLLLQDKLILFYQDLRNSGVPVSFVEPDGDDDDDDDDEEDEDLAAETPETPEA